MAKLPLTLDNDGGSWDELAEKAGIVLIPSEPGDRFDMETDLTVYWPTVRRDWEPERPFLEKYGTWENYIRSTQMKGK